MLSPGFLRVASSLCSARPGLRMFLVVYLCYLSRPKNSLLCVLIEHAAWCSWSKLSRSLEFTRAGIWATQLCQSAVVHFLSLFHHWHDVTLRCVHQICLSCGEPSSSCWYLICKILVSHVEIVLSNCLGIALPSLRALWARAARSLAATTELLWSFARGWCCPCWHEVCSVAIG